MTKKEEKRGKAHATEVDISNGALFLRIADLERTVKYLMREVDDLKVAARNIPFRVGSETGGNE